MGNKPSKKEAALNPADARAIEAFNRAEAERVQAKAEWDEE
jgi:hypothetical protein